ncbi:hypothetical protein OKJ48_00015 [Streptomyces kunmingensis]|uniref:Uncharacterized protein n=1 Tax=Streptomyces kunmingensis TaxID=68225 RepID=A0ABU6C295_9ACTN|nr:hypothetical protein [Streptomyces kunmingensis]MEB3958654.1 hypothetical protein [Streptomyces kunmingensis]
MFVELDAVRRLALPKVVTVCNDDAYGAEVHHVGPDGRALVTVEFVLTDIAAVGRGYGFEEVPVRRGEDPKAVGHWVERPRTAPLPIAAKAPANTAPGGWRRRCVGTEPSKGAD